MDRAPTDRPTSSASSSASGSLNFIRSGPNGHRPTPRSNWGLLTPPCSPPLSPRRISSAVDRSYSVRSQVPLAQVPPLGTRALQLLPGLPAPSGLTLSRLLGRLRPLTCSLNFASHLPVLSSGQGSGACGKPKIIIPTSFWLGFTLSFGDRG